MLRLTDAGALKLTDTLEKYIPGIINGTKITLEHGRSAFAITEKSAGVGAAGHGICDKSAPRRVGLVRLVDRCGTCGRRAATGSPGETCGASCGRKVVAANDEIRRFDVQVLRI